METQKDLRALSERTGIPQICFAAALDTHERARVVAEARTVRLGPTSKRQKQEDVWRAQWSATDRSVAYARKKFIDAPLGSEDEKQAITEWDTLSLKLVSLAKNAQDAKTACLGARPNSEPWRIAYEHWKKLSLVQVALAKNLDKAKMAFFFSYGCLEAEKAALAKYVGLSLKEIAVAKTLDDAIRAYHRAPEHTAANKAALLKIYELF